MERPLRRIPNLLQQSRRQQRLKPDQPTAVLQILEAVILEIATAEHLEVAIPEIATVERLEAATAEAIIPEAARMEAQRRVVTAEVPTLEAPHQVQTLEATTVEIQVQMERCQFQIVDLELESWIRHFWTTLEPVETAEEIQPVHRILTFS